jgi:putative transposase
MWYVVGMSQHLCVTLTEQNRSHLESLIKKGNAPARVQTRARILLLADRNQDQPQTQERIAKALLTSRPTIGLTCRRFAQEGIEGALYEKPRPGQKPKITGQVEAHLVALACSTPPEGRVRWTLRLLADKLVELRLVDAISEVAIHQRLKKTTLNPGS